ncbi:MAG TPA: hypothetical protein VMN57_09860 [Anaerolineales bacterium]|nr:hypothetical protein [Anaerolineales bacterium]
MKPTIFKTAPAHIARWVLAAAAAAIALAGSTGIAHAHTRVEIGPYTLVLGWLNEPVIVGERNALVLEIIEDGSPVPGVEGSLELTVLYGGQTFHGQLAPTQAPGVYAAEIFPTVRGQYEVRLVGMIVDEPVDVVIEPEAVLPAAVLQFPETQPEPAVLTAEIDQLAEAVAQIRTLAMLGLAAGSAGILLSAAGLFLGLRRRSSPGRRRGAANQQEQK